MKTDLIIKSVFGGLIGVLSYCFGEFDRTIQILLLFIIIDYITGVFKAIANKQLSSEVGFRGIVKKFYILVVVTIAIQLDKMLGQAYIFRTAICYFYIGNEGISIVENISFMGVPLPSFIKDMLVKIQQTGETAQAPQTIKEDIPPGGGGQ